MTPSLETDRLLLEPLRLSDAELTQLLFPKWEIVRFLNTSIPWPYPQDGALTYYRNVALPAIARGDEWHWILRLKQAPAHHIGSILLSRKPGDNRGFWLGLEWQRQGLMTEAVAAVNDYWFDVLRFATLSSPKARDNIGSRRISEKTGMSMTGLLERDYVSGRQPSECGRLRAINGAVTRRKIAPDQPSAN